MGLTKDIARTSGLEQALQFGGRAESEAMFTAKFWHMWDLTWRAKEYDDEHHADMAAEVDRNLRSLADVIRQVDTSATRTFERRSVPDARPHLSTYCCAPASGRYVVFSDLHITDRGNRQDFFEKKNKGLYLDVLKTYYGTKDFALVENGDVEELLVQEPDLATMPDFENDAWQTIIDDRKDRKFAQFQRILDDHSDYYAVINTHFIARNAYFRTIGNHDYDLATERYNDELEAQLGFRFPLASDFLFLTQAGEVTEIICHGHQFDSACSAKHAAFAGESYSQGGAWAIQGPDRHWTLEKDGASFINPWNRGDKPFANMLVNTEVGLPGPTSDIEIAIAFAGKEMGNLHDRNSWEDVYTKNVAWEYFINADPQNAYNNEIITGTRWFKFRHMDEERIVQLFDEQFPSGQVRLTLGHSHEPRINAGKPSIGLSAAQQATRYQNAAAAGRFENMIWGIEFDDGAVTLVSWSRHEDGEQISRNVWTESDFANQRLLTVSSSSLFDPLHPPIIALPFPLPAILNLLIV